MVDPDRNLMYVMNPQGGIDAVNLTAGEGVWSTNQAAKPILLINDLLICQADSRGLSNVLNIAVLRVQEQGALAFRDSVNLPQNVRVSIDRLMNSSFTTLPQSTPENVLVFWEYSFQPIRGLPPPDTVPDLPQITRSAVQIDLMAGRVTALSPSELPPFPTRPAPDLPDTARIANVPGIQFVAADGNHVLTSARIADERTWDKYNWTIYARTNGNVIGNIRNFQSRSPFFITDSTIIYETIPYQRQGFPDEPLKVRARDLRTGRELWSWVIRDTTFRGPYPP